MTFMPLNWAKCGKKFPAVLIVLGGDVQRTASYVQMEEIVVHSHPAPSILTYISLVFCCCLGLLASHFTHESDTYLACGHLDMTATKQIVESCC